MAREGITQAQVFNAADAISSAGQAPTVAGVRAKLGTGSFTTITTHLRAWKEQALTQANDDALDVPEEVTAALGRAAEIVWRAANEHFARELAALRKAADEHELANIAELNDAGDEIERLEKVAASWEEQHEKLSARITELDNTLADAFRQIADLKDERTEHRAQLKAASARIQEQSDLLRRLVPEKQTSPKAKRTRRPADEPAADIYTKPLEI